MQPHKTVYQQVMFVYMLYIRNKLVHKQRKIAVRFDATFAEPHKHDICMLCIMRLCTGILDAPSAPLTKSFVTTSSCLCSAEPLQSDCGAQLPLLAVSTLTLSLLECHYNMTTLHLCMVWAAWPDTGCFVEASQSKHMLAFLLCQVLSCLYMLTCLC